MHTLEQTLKRSRTAPPGPAPTSRLMIVEDDATLASGLARAMQNEGYEVTQVDTGEAALDALGEARFDLLVLDIGLPGIDGFEVLRRLRTAGQALPVLVLTARDAVDDRVAGLDSGADDYLVKPFAFAELLARLRALARRGATGRPAVLEVGDLRLDPATRGVARGERPIELSAKEFALLETFMRRPGEVLDRLYLLEHAWDIAYDNRSNVVDVLVGRLRRKIDEPFGCCTLETVRGAGYRLRTDET
jgi:two-component system, OmpR family, response regulator